MKKLNDRHPRPSIIAVAGVLAAPAMVGGASASMSNSRVIAGLVDVNTNLGYENAAAAGTGMAITSSGEILTNNHVIRGATTTQVREVNDGKIYSASIVGYDVEADVVVLQLKDASKLKTEPIGNSASVKVDSKVAAIGNAGSTGGVPTSANGTVMALDQTITASDQFYDTNEQLTGLIETNASIEPGDSGGALANVKGNVIGITTAASSGFEFQPGGNEGFAIPIGTVISIAGRIERGNFVGNVHRGATAFLGVDVQSSGYFTGGSFLAGALVVGIVPGSPVIHTGLVLGDVITSFANQPITSPTALTNALLGRAQEQTCGSAGSLNSE